MPQNLEKKNPETHLEIKNVRGGYGEYNVLEDISLEVLSGEVVALLGPNGHGKSTLLKMLSGLVPILAGNVFFNNSLINNFQPSEIVNLGISHIPQGDMIFPEMKVVENLLAGAYMQWSERGVLMNEVLLKFENLKERLNQPARILSGGERRMLSIARGLMCSPKLLLIDEPSLGLAPKLKETVYEMLKGISSQGISILIVEEKIDYLRDFADKIYVLESGRIALSGESAEILNSKDELLSAYVG
tara:strand:- start:163 stop:897 length:735 start_codon:yes stop_codon:yes gene_type:complete